MSDVKMPRKYGLEYRKFRVRGNIRSFRDLEIYQQTTRLASQIFQMELPKNLKNRLKISEELEILYAIAKSIPKLIAESYGDRFTNRGLAFRKLETSVQTAANAIAKLDFLVNVTESQELKDTFTKLIRKYQFQRRKILNLKRAWQRIEKKLKTINNC